MDYFYQQKLINEKNQLQRQLMEAERKLKSLTEQVGDYDLLVSLLKEGVDLQEIIAFTDAERAANPHIRALETHQAKRLRGVMDRANTGTLRVRSVSLPDELPHHKVVPIDQASKNSQTDARARLIAMSRSRGLDVIDSGNQIRAIGPRGRPVVDKTTPMSLLAVPHSERREAANKVTPLRKGVQFAGAMADREIEERNKRKDYEDSLTIEESNWQPGQGVPHPNRAEIMATHNWEKSSLAPGMLTAYLSGAPRGKVTRGDMEAEEGIHKKGRVNRPVK